MGGSYHDHKKTRQMKKMARAERYRVYFYRYARVLFEDLLYRTCSFTLSSILQPIEVNPLMEIDLQKSR